MLIINNFFLNNYIEICLDLRFNQLKKIISNFLKTNYLYDQRTKCEDFLPKEFIIELVRNLSNSKKVKENYKNFYFDYTVINFNENKERDSFKRDIFPIQENLFDSPKKLTYYNITIDDKNPIFLLIDMLLIYNVFEKLKFEEFSITKHYKIKTIKDSPITASFIYSKEKISDDKLDFYFYFTTNEEENNDGLKKEYDKELIKIILRNSLDSLLDTN